MPGNEKPWWILVGGQKRLGRALAEDLARDHALVLTSSMEMDLPWLATLADRTLTRTFRWNALDPDFSSQMMADLEGLKTGGICLSGAVIAAGTFPEQKMGAWTVDDLESTWRMNLTFPFLCAQALATQLEPESCIQFLLDTAIHRPWLKRLPYSAAKSGLAALVPGLAQLLAPRIRVVGHALGTVLPDASSNPDWLAARSLLQRNGDPTDVARALRFAAESPYMTGEIITLDGGRRWA